MIKAILNIIAYSEYIIVAFWKFEKIIHLKLAMASLSIHLEGLNLDKNRDLGAIPKSASIGCVPGTPSNTPSTPSSNPKNRRNRRQRQRNKQNQTSISNRNESSSHLLQPSLSASEISSNLTGDRRVPEIPEPPEVLPLVEQVGGHSKVCEKSEGKDSSCRKGDGTLEVQSENVDSPKVSNKKGGSRRNRRTAAGKRKKPTEDGVLSIDSRKDRWKNTENKENSKAFNEDFPHLAESDLGTLESPIV